MYLDDIRAFVPQCEQEEADRRVILAWAERLGDAVLSRESASAHLTASGLVLNRARTRVLMARHDLYRVWAWTGGHADGDGDLLRVALREAREETGASGLRPVTGQIDSLEILPVWGHVKRGRYVPAHLHLNVSYLLEADEDGPLAPCPGENSAVAWLPVEGLLARTNEWQMDGIYTKLLRRGGTVSASAGAAPQGRSGK